MFHTFMWFIILTHNCHRLIHGRTHVMHIQLFEIVTDAQPNEKQVEF